MENKVAQPSKSIENRDPGFARIRKGLLAHLPGMSGNDVKLYLMLHFKACWFGPKRGWVEASFDDMARWCGWSTKTLQRAVEELEAKPYIGVERATNQHELTRIKILKYDLEESTSAMDKSDQSSTVGVDSAVDCAVDSGADKPVHSKRASPQNQQDLQAPKKLKKLKNIRREDEDAVRRRVDAELTASIPPLDQRPSQKPNPSLERKANPTSSLRTKLEVRLAGKIESEHEERFSSWIAVCQKKGWAHPFGAEERAAFKALQYEPDLQSPHLSFSFVMSAAYVHEKNKGKDVTPGNLCSKVIDYCMTQIGRSGGECGGSYYWPPDFQDHRDRLRAQEIRVEQRASPEARA
jgi:hypothetical protein